VRTSVQGDGALVRLAEDLVALVVKVELAVGVGRAKEDGGDLGLGDLLGEQRVELGLALGGDAWLGGDGHGGVMGGGEVGRPMCQH
jgi:hypothetical protein